MVYAGHRGEHGRWEGRTAAFASRMGEEFDFGEQGGTASAGSRLAALGYQYLRCVMEVRARAGLEASPMRPPPRRSSVQ